MNGKGTITFKDGTSYTGDFKDNKMEGYGTETFPNGSIYKGQFLDNQR
jgi:hypothetical protein